MTFWEKFKRSNFLIRLKSWEYWPFGIVQFPAIIYWLWLSVKARSLVFFTASNPGIPMGGMFGESKFDILNKIPHQYVPQTVLIRLPTSVNEVMQRLESEGMKFPIILKPDIGERGFMVRRIHNEQEIARYLRDVPGDFIAQDLLTQPLEFGVFYLRFPGDEKGRVISLVGKEMLSVTGDGVSTLQQLILRHDRAKLQWRKLQVEFGNALATIVKRDQRIELVSIGNHAQGTRFINANHLINQNLSDAFDSISKSIPGFYFGRFDVRCGSIQDLFAGNIKIMELNGCGAEPAHIYDSKFSLWQAFYELVKHWNYIFRIARANNHRGVRYVTHREALSYYRRFKSVVR